MKDVTRLCDRSRYGQALLRIVVGLIFLEHGSAKLFGVPSVPTLVQTFQVFGPWAEAFKLTAGLIETIGGLLLVAGLFTRSIAFLLSGLAAVAYFSVHARQSFFPVLSGGDLAVLTCFACLFLSAAGSGNWAIDNRRG